MQLFVTLCMFPQTGVRCYTKQCYIHIVVYSIKINSAYVSVSVYVSN